MQGVVHSYGFTDHIAINGCHADDFVVGNVTAHIPEIDRKNAVKNMFFIRHGSIFGFIHFDRVLQEFVFLAVKNVYKIIVAVIFRMKSRFFDT